MLVLGSFGLVLLVCVGGMGLGLGLGTVVHSIAITLSYICWYSAIVHPEQSTNVLCINQLWFSYAFNNSICT